MYRTGKSYLLNRMLLNRQKGFSVGPTVNPCTKGLWIWSKPIYGTSEDGSRLPVLLIDTEGFGAFDEDQNHDVRIFTLAILLSSYFVYNSLGSIDENAIQSLSFVINLSKHIHMKSNSEFTETDPDELANLFPSFLWVLRDFSLQLVDDNGEQITPKEYLEKVMDTTKSFNEGDSKNKIRKLIRTYFKDRDCFTMVRPLLKEKELQSLENMGPEKLRPEFLEQILYLRKKILNRVKVKTFKGKPLTGDMFLNIIKSLINAINAGKVPNIENTWNAMCKVESYKAFEEAERVYESVLRETFDSSASVNEEIIQQIHAEAKKRSIKLYRQKSLGDVSMDFEKQLKEKMKEKLSYYTKLNEEETKSNMIRVLQKSYSMIEYKIQSGELKNVDDIENDFKGLEYKLNEAFPQFSLRNEYFCDFKSKILNFAGDFFLNKMNNEMKLQKNENSQMINKLNSDISDMKSNFDREISKKNNSLETLKHENTELKDEVSSLKEKLAILEKDKEMTQKNSQAQLDRLKEEYDRKINEISSKNNLNEEKTKEAERRAITVQAEAEREKALLEQKIEHFTKQIEEYARREKESGQEVKSQIREQSNALRETTLKFDAQVKSLNSQNENLKEKILDLEALLGNKEQLYETEKIRADDLQIKFNIETKDLNEKLSMLKKLLADEKSKNSEERKATEAEYSNKLSLLKIKNDELELQTKTNEENLKNQIIKLERENAVLRQNNEFLEIKVKDLSLGMEEQKKNHENIISSLESKTFSMVGHEEFQKKVDEIKLYFENEKKHLEDSYEKSKTIYISQIDSITEKLNEADFKGKVDREEMQRDLNETKNRFDKLSKEYNNLLVEKRNLSESLANSNEELQNKLKSIHDEYERKMEEKERMNQKEISDLNKNSEETISQLKALFETEKIRFEDKLKEEKLRNEKKIKYTIEEYEAKLKEIETDLRDELENSQNEYADLESSHHNYVSNAEHEMEMLNQKIEALEAYLRDAKEVIATTQSQSASNIEQATENFNKERRELHNRIESLSNDASNKEKELASLQLKRDALERTIHEKDSQLNTQRKENEEEKKDLSAKLEAYKIKYQESNDEFMIKKLEFTRESALLKQQIEFLNKKIEDLQKNIEESQKRYEERLFGLRSEVEKDLNEKFDRLKKEREELEAKLLQKKKEVRDLEQTFIKQNNLMEKEKTTLNEKLANLEEDKKELVENYEKDISTLTSSLKNLKLELTSTKDDNVSCKDTLKKRVAVLEVDLQEKTSQLEKEQILWEGKIKFIEQQRDNYKKDLNETQKRFENMLDSIQKKGNMDKEKLESAQQSQIASLEQKYITQIKEMQDTHQKLYSELLSSNKDLERELKSVNLQMEINKNKAIDPNQVNKKIEELMDEREKLKRSIEDVKKDRDAKLIEAQSFAEKEKDILKLKITDIENRLREVEGKRGAMLLEYEKDKAKWSLEKDHFNSKSTELQENVERLEKKVETLLRENEKLKADKNNSKRSSSIKQNQMVNNSFIGAIANAGGFMPTKEMAQFASNKVFNPLSNNPYQKDFNKLFENDLNSSRFLSSDRNDSNKSFEKYDSNLNSNRYENPYSKLAHKFSIRPTANLNSSSSTVNTQGNQQKEENGNGNTEEK